MNQGLWRARTTTLIGGPILLFVASRIVYLLLLDPQAIVQHGGYGQLYRGMIGHELITGLKIPFLDYRADNYAGGSLVIGAVASVFFLVLGSTVFALKLAPILFFALTLLCWLLLLERTAGPRVALNFGLLFCFSPPQFTEYSVTAMGYHSESIFFTALTLVLLFRMLSEGTDSRVIPAALGVTAGFGLWFDYVYGLTLLALLFVWIISTKVTSQRQIVWTAAGFVAGFSPWLIINLKNRFAGLVVVDKPIWDHFGLSYLVDGFTHPRRFAPILFLATLGSADRSDLYGWMANGAYFVILVAPIVIAGVAATASRRSGGRGVLQSMSVLTTFAAIYLALSVVAFQASDLRESSYRVPIYPVVFFLTALSVVRLAEMHPPVGGRMVRAWVGIVALTVILAHMPALSLDRPGYALTAKGYTYAGLPEMYFGVHSVSRAGENVWSPGLIHGRVPDAVRRGLRGEDWRDLSIAEAQSLAYFAPAAARDEDLMLAAASLPEGFRPYFYYSVGSTTVERQRGFSDALNRIEFLRGAPDNAYRIALAGLLQSWCTSTPARTNPSPLALIGAAGAFEITVYYWRSLGCRSSSYWRNSTPADALSEQLQSVVPSLDPEVRRYFLEGVGEGLFAFPPAAQWIPLQRLPGQYRRELLMGWGIALGKFELEAGLPWKGRDGPFWSAWTRELSSQDLEAVNEGRSQFERIVEHTSSAPSD